MVHVGFRKRALLAYGRCSKRFLKAFSAVTTNAEDGYPVYRRRDNGVLLMWAGHNWIIGGLYPTIRTFCLSLMLTLMLRSVVQCVQSSIHDRAIKEFKAGGENVDNAESKSVNEISPYLEGRYVSATEALMNSMPI